jgi:hypothetical protein
MPHWDGSPRRKIIAALFIAAYLLPLTFLFLLSIVAIFRPWPARSLLVLGFGFPLLALWHAAVRYPFFEKGRPPFPWTESRTKITLFLLLQGVLAVTVAIIGSTLVRQANGYPTIPDAIVSIVGYAGIPAALFAAAVLLKAWKEREADAI